MKSLSDMVSRIGSVIFKSVKITFDGEAAERDKKVAVILEQFRKYSPTQVESEQRTEILLHRVFVTNAVKISRASTSGCEIVVLGNDK